MTGTGAISSGTQELQKTGTAQQVGQTGQPTDKLNPITTTEHHIDTSLQTQPNQRHDAVKNVNQSDNPTAGPSTQGLNTNATRESNKEQVYFPELAPLFGNALCTGISSVDEKANPNPVCNANSEQPQAPITQGVAGNTTINKAISSGQHPHLDEDINNAVQAYFNPEPKKTTNAQGFLDALKNANIAKDNGDIDFKELGLDASTIKKAGIKGTFLVQEDGSFDFEIKGKCSEEAKECLEKLKRKLEEIKKDTKFDGPININPDAVGPLSAADRTIIERGGQIQYRPLPDNGVMKLILDPGSGGQNNGLTINVYNEDFFNCKDLPTPQNTQTIPLNVVFEGAAFNGQKGVLAFLRDWRDQNLFEKSVINTKKDLFFKNETNEDDINRTQIQNKLWNAVNEYLKASIETTEGHFNSSNKPSEDKAQKKPITNKPDDTDTIELAKCRPVDINSQTTGPETALPKNDQQDKSSIEENPQGQDQNINSLRLKNEPDDTDIIELSQSRPIDINSQTTGPQTALPINDQQDKSSIEVITQEQDPKINSLGLNIAVDLKGKTSNSINSQTENDEDSNAVGINANHSVAIEKATIGVNKKEEPPQEQDRLIDIHPSDGDLGSKDDPLLVTIKEIVYELKKLEKISEKTPPELNSEVKGIIAKGKVLKQKIEASAKRSNVEQIIKALKDLNTALQNLTSLLENEDKALQEESVEAPADNNNNTAKKRIALLAKATQGQKKDSTNSRNQLLEAAKKVADAMKNIINNTVDTQEQGQAINSGNNKEELKENWKKVMNELLQKMQNKTQETKQKV